MESGADRRRHPRVELRVPVRLSTIDAEPDPRTGRASFRTSEETSANVSRGGLFVATTDPVSPGRRVLLELELPGGRRLETVGRVAWTRARTGGAGRDGEGFGIEFLGGRPEDLAKLERILAPRRRAPRARTPQPGPTPGGA